MDDLGRVGETEELGGHVSLSLHPCATLEIKMSLLLSIQGFSGCALRNSFLHCFESLR